jgi:HK97 family phage prohead protease
VRFVLEPEWEIRDEPDGDGRTIEGLIVPYGVTTDRPDGAEAFAPGVFSEVEPESVVLLWQHDTSAPLGRMTELRDDSDGAHGTFRLANTERAREALSLIRDGITRGLSVGFEPGEHRREKGVRVHTKARLREASLVTFPAYPSAAVLAVREEGEGMADDVMVDEAEVEAPPIPDTTELETRLEARMEHLGRELRNQISNISVAGEVVPPMSLHRAMAELLVTVAKAPGEKRALADVIGTAPGNASGLIRDAWVSELLGYINNLRPFFSAAGTVGFPASGYGLAFPRITQHTLVGKRGAEKTEIPSRELTVAPGNYPMEWFAGGVDVALELIAQSDPSVLEVVTSDLMDQYANATETEFVADTEAAATVGGAVLPTADWGAFSAAVIATSAEIRAATGVPGDRLALTTASWQAVVGLLNPSQPSISFGAGPDFTAESVNVGGVTAFHSPASAADVQFNEKSLRKSENPPETVTSNNVALMGRDIGILGATIHLPLYPAGIVKYTALAARAAKS